MTLTFRSLNEVHSIVSTQLVKKCLLRKTTHLRVATSLCFKARLSLKLLIWKWFCILMQMTFIKARKVLQFAPFWKWGFLELGNGLSWTAKALVANQAADVFLGFLTFFTQCPRSRIFFSNTAWISYKHPTCLLNSLCCKKGRLSKCEWKRSDLFNFALTRTSAK